MNYFLHVVLLVFFAGEILATVPDHNWTSPLKECANIALENKLDHNLTKEELFTIKEFECNYASGEIDLEAIRDLTSVEVLRMRGNTIVRWAESTNLDTNETTIAKSMGTIPTWIGELTALKILDLSGNRLKGNIPDEIGLLTNLEKLDLSVNGLTKIPKELGNLTNLKELHLASCRFVQTIPKELGNLTSLTHLYLQDNRLHQTIPKELGNLTNLKKLRLNQNNLKGSIPVELTDLNLSQPNGLGLHENCNLKLEFPDCNASDENDTRCDVLADSNTTRAWIDLKSSLYRGYDGMRSTGGNCWTPAMVPIMWYLLSKTLIATLDVIAENDILDATERGNDLNISGTTIGIEDNQTARVFFNDINYTSDVVDGVFFVIVPAVDVGNLAVNTTYTVFVEAYDVDGGRASSSRDVNTVE